MQARKLSFQEAWDSSTIFFVDDELENEIDGKAARLMDLAGSFEISSEQTTLDDLIRSLKKNPEGLDAVLRDIGLSDEKFMRIISLLRKIERIEGGFDREWSIRKIKKLLEKDEEFLNLTAMLLYDGCRDEELGTIIPRFYLEKLNYREIGAIPEALKKIRYKESTIGSYGALKGHKVEAFIQNKLDEINSSCGVGYEKGRSRMINVDIDFAIPSLQDPWVIIMSSFQETTSSGQTVKARDMFNAYHQINAANSRHNENRAFVNFVDGGGWLARRRDLERLVDECHYFINLNSIDMLESIVPLHVPERYLSR